MKARYEIIDHTADVGIAAYGSDMAEAFASAARGMFSLMVDIESVSDAVSQTIDIHADNREDLLVSWLNEMIYRCEVDGMLFSRFEVNRLTHREMDATCYGERIDPQRHRIKTGIKAATYHNVRIDKVDGGYRVQVLFDI